MFLSYQGLLLTALASFVISSVPAICGDIRNDAFPNRASGILFEGAIENGDYEKLRNYILNNKNVSEIYFASPGGNLSEAMKIGRLVRKFKLSTIIPTSDYTPDVRFKLAKQHGIKDIQSNYVCASACFFAYIGGIYRDADGDSVLLGIHKPYLTTKDLIAIDSDSAIESDNNTRNAVDVYLRDMSVSSLFLEEMFATPKDKIHWISDRI